MAIVERIMAAVPQNIQQAQTITSTITVSEPGVLALDRMTLGVAYGDAPGGLPTYSDYNITNASYVQSLLWNGAQELIRGRNNPDAPGGAFSALRANTYIPLGDYAAQSSDTLALQLRMPANTIGPAPANSSFSFAAPIVPQNRRQGFTGALPKAVAYVASPTQTFAAGGAGVLTLTADSDMVIDLSSICISVLPDMNGVGGLQTASFDATIGAGITQITTATGERLILGQGAPAVLGTIFSAERAGNWVNLGYEQVQGGSAITMNITNLLGVQSSFSFGAICYPRNGEGC
jgi:hypothetical protein